MYLRTTRRKNKNGTVTEYYQLAHNERDPANNNTVAKIVYSFGRADQLDREALVRLCKSIARICDIKIIDPMADETGQNGLLPRDVTISHTVELGTVLTIEALWERLEIGKILRQLMTKKKLTVPYDQALLAMVANRLCEPESKLGVWDRWLEKVYLPGCKELKLRQMYDAMDFLHDHMDEIEEAIFFRTANLLNLSVDLIFYDTTTASFAIDYEDEPDEDEEGLRRYGHSKEGTWTPQVVVALAVTREGLPVKSWVLPGNTADVSTVEKVKSDLRGWQLKHREELVLMLEEELAGHRDKDAGAQWAIELLASRRYKKYLTVTEVGNLRIDRPAIKEAARYDGKWVLETNDDTISLEDAALGYRGLMVIERCFRALKRTQIKMTPMFHWAPRRIETHVKLCVLALLLERVAELACEKPWPQIRRALAKLQATKFIARDHTFLQINEPEKSVRQTLKNLKIPLPKRVFGIEQIEKHSAIV